MQVPRAKRISGVGPREMFVVLQAGQKGPKSSHASAVSRFFWITRTQSSDVTTVDAAAMRTAQQPRADVSRTLACIGGFAIFLDHEAADDDEDDAAAESGR